MITPGEETLGKALNVAANNNDSKKPLNYFTITPRGKYLLDQIVKVYQ